MWWRVDFLMATSLVVRWLGGGMTANGVKIAILGTALHVHHTFWDIYLPPLNYFDVNFPDFKISEGWKHNETIFYSFSVLYLDAVLDSLTSEKKFFAKLRSVLLFNSLFSNSAPTLRSHTPRSSCDVRRSTFRQVYCYFLCSTDTPKQYSKYLRMIAWSNLQSSVCIFLGSCWAILRHFL